MNEHDVFMESYFPRAVDYPGAKVSNILPYGELWCYVANSFLNGFVNYVTPLSWWLVNRYTGWDAILKDVSHTDPPGSLNWTKKDFTKRELFNLWKQHPKMFVHTHLHIFGDDIVMLGHCPDNPTTYMYFWFDSEVSDCQIGRFQTDDHPTWVAAAFNEHAAKVGRAVSDDYGQHLDAEKMPLELLGGWFSF